MRMISRALLPVCLLAAAPAGAQTYVGALGGPSFARMSVDDVADVDISTRTGFSLGVVLGRELREGLRLELQPLFAARGANLSSDGERGSARFRYFELPLFLKVSGRGHGVRPYVLAGPVLAFRQSATLEVAGLSEDVKDQVRGTDFGLALGAGVRVPAGRGAVLVEGHYDLGLRNIAIVEPGDEPANAKNRAFQLKLGFVFPLGG